MKNKQKLDIEIMRIIAAYFVIFNHTGDKGYFLFSLYDKQSLHFWIYLFISVFCKFSVPLFFMITGALMLNREPEPLENLWKNRIFNMMKVLLLWSLFYYFVEICMGTQEFSVKNFVIRFYDSSWNVSFWYLYAYIPLLMSLPILQKFAKSLSDKDFIYLILLFMAFNSLLPVFQYYFWQERHNLNSNFRLNWICSIVFFYPCLGYFLEHRIRQFWNKKKIVLLWIINFLSIIISCYMTYMKINNTGISDGANSETFHSTFVFINCIAVYVSCQYFFREKEVNEILKKVIISIGECTFGIYLLHALFNSRIEPITRLWDIFRNQLHINYMISALIYSACVFLLSYALTFLLKKISFMKKII